MKSILLSTLIAIATFIAVMVARRGPDAGPDLTDIARNLHSPDPKTRQAAVMALAGRSKPGEAQVAMRTLLTVVREDDPAIRVTIDRAISNMRDPQMIAWMTSDGLTFPERWTRYYAVRVLQTQKGAAAIPLLLPHLAENYWQVQLAILDVIEAAGGQAQAVESLAPLTSPGRNWRVRERAIRLLGQANTAAAARSLFSQALPPSDKPRDVDAELTVENALAAMSDKEARAFVENQIGTAGDPVRRLLAIRAAGRAGGPELFGKLKAIVEDASVAQPVRISALRAAVQSGGEEGVKLALAQLDGADGAVRLEAAYVLGEVPLAEGQKLELRGRMEKEQDWRVKQALGVAAGGN